MKIKNYIPVILCSIALCSCSDADKNIAFGLDSDAIKAEAAGGSHKIKVSASGDWVATTDEPWISISPANGRGTTECRILIDSALTDSPRRGVVRIQEQNTWDKKEITIDHIIKVVCEYLNLDFERFNSTERTREIAQARQIAMYLAKQHTKAPLTTIGAAIGGRNHATVLHSCKAVSNLIETDKAFRRQVEEIEKKVLAQ